MPNSNNIKLNNLNQTFIRCSSHTLCGIKPANLFTISLADFSLSVFEEWKQIAAEQNLMICAFKSSANAMMIFIYDFVWIRNILSNSFVQAYLNGKGYANISDTCKTLEELFVRLQTEKSFPHEVGIFLGYPVEDVINFEEKQGKFCRYCGYWKAYCNPEEAKKCCDRYKQCSEMCKKWFDEGYSVPQIIKKYKKAVQTAA